MLLFDSFLCLLASASIAFASPVANPQALFCDTNGLLALMNNDYTPSRTAPAPTSAQTESEGSFGAAAFSGDDNQPTETDTGPTETGLPSGCDTNVCPDVVDRSACISQNLNTGDLGAVVGCVGWDTSMIAELCYCQVCINGLDVLTTVGFCDGQRPAQSQENSRL